MFNMSIFEYIYGPEMYFDAELHWCSSYVSWKLLTYYVYIHNSAVWNVVIYLKHRQEFCRNHVCVLNNILTRSFRHMESHLFGVRSTYKLWPAAN